jgi:uncharacterized membrane protein YjjP (DUF1212 family)
MSPRLVHVLAWPVMAGGLAVLFTGASLGVLATGFGLLIAAALMSSYGRG